MDPWGSFDSSPTTQLSSLTPWNAIDEVLPDWSTPATPLAPPATREQVDIESNVENERGATFSAQNSNSDSLVASNNIAVEDDDEEEDPWASFVSTPAVPLTQPEVDDKIIQPEKKNGQLEDQKADIALGSDEIETDLSNLKVADAKSPKEENGVTESRAQPEANSAFAVESSGSETALQSTEVNGEKIEITKSNTNEFDAFESRAPEEEKDATTESPELNGNINEIGQSESSMADEDATSLSQEDGAANDQIRQISAAEAVSGEVQETSESTGEAEKEAVTSVVSPVAEQNAQDTDAFTETTNGFADDDDTDFAGFSAALPSFPAPSAPFDYASSGFDDHLASPTDGFRFGGVGDFADPFGSADMDLANPFEADSLRPPEEPSYQALCDVFPLPEVQDQERENVASFFSEAQSAPGSLLNYGKAYDCFVSAHHCSFINLM